MDTLQAKAVYEASQTVGIVQNGKEPANLCCRDGNFPVRVAGGDRFESEDELRSWLDEDKISYTDGVLSAALYQLERFGRLKRPRADHWRSDLSLPGV